MPAILSAVVCAATILSCAIGLTAPAQPIEGHGRASATATPAIVVHGKVSSLTVDQHGTTLTIVTAAGNRLIRLAADAHAQEQPAHGVWTDVPLTSLKVREPVDVTLNAAGVGELIRSATSRIATRLVIVENGYAVTTNGNAYRLLGAAAAEAIGLPLGTYLVLKTDPDTGDAFDLVASRVPLTVEGTTERTVAVTFMVQVPVNTPSTDVIYMATDRTTWTPNAIRMSPLPGNKWTTTLTLTGGSIVAYKYTRGSWPTDERNAAGSEISNRTLTVTSSSDAQTITDAVTRWADLPS
jgi:hypothetical protein